MNLKQKNNTILNCWYLTDLSVGFDWVGGRWNRIGQMLFLLFSDVNEPTLKALICCRNRVSIIGYTSFKSGKPSAASEFFLFSVPKKVCNNCAIGSCLICMYVCVCWWLFLIKQLTFFRAPFCRAMFVLFVLFCLFVCFCFEYFFKVDKLDEKNKFKQKKPIRKNEKILKNKNLFFAVEITTTE